MSARRFGQRACESKRWVSFHYITDLGDLPISTKREFAPGQLALAALEINAACNTTVVLARMMRKGRLAFALRGTIDPGSKGP